MSLIRCAFCPLERTFSTCTHLTGCAHLSLVHDGTKIDEGISQFLRSRLHCIGTSTYKYNYMSTLLLAAFATCVLSHLIIYFSCLTCRPFQSFCFRFLLSISFSFHFRVHPSHSLSLLFARRPAQQKKQRRTLRRRMRARSMGPREHAN